MSALVRVIRASRDAAQGIGAKFWQVEFEVEAHNATMYRAQAGFVLEASSGRPIGTVTLPTDRPDWVRVGDWEFEDCLRNYFAGVVVPILQGSAATDQPVLVVEKDFVQEFEVGIVTPRLVGRHLPSRPSNQVRKWAVSRPPQRESMART